MIENERLNWVKKIDEMIPHRSFHFTYEALTLLALSRYPVYFAIVNNLYTFSNSMQRSRAFHYDYVFPRPNSDLSGSMIRLKCGIRSVLNESDTS
jgi:hypothetical protein